MRSSIRLRPEAERDIVEAYAWYEQQLEGLGGRFVEKLDEAFIAISQAPELHAVVHRGIRQTLVGKFPYVVCYLTNPSEVEVVAVFHASRDRSAWWSRVDKQRER